MTYAFFTPILDSLLLVPMAASTSTAQLIAAIPGHLRPHLQRARDLARQRSERPANERALGITSVDRLLGGGVAQGQMIEIVGRASSGRFSFALGVLATATARGEDCALIDLGDTLDPQNAVAFGIDPARLLWIRPTHLKPALQATEALLGAAFPVVVLDLGIPPIPGGRGAETSWRRLARSLAGRPSILLVSSPYRVSGAAARTVLRLGSERPRWSGGRLSGALLERLTTRVELERSQAPPPYGSTALPLVSPANPLSLSRPDSPEPCGSSVC